MKKDLQSIRGDMDKLEGVFIPLENNGREVSVSFFKNSSIGIWVGKSGEPSTYRIDINLETGFISLLKR